MPPRMRERILLWMVTPFPTFLGLLFVYDLLDGRTWVMSDRSVPVTLWYNPGLFAMAAGLCALFCIAAALFWLALINNWNEEWLPPRLRDRPHLATVLLIFLTLGAMLLGRQLLTGEIMLSGKRMAFIGRHLSVDGTPIRFALFSAAYVGICAGIALAWFFTLKRWVQGRKERWRPMFDDPSKRTGLR